MKIKTDFRMMLDLEIEGEFIPGLSEPDTVENIKAFIKVEKIWVKLDDTIASKHHKAFEEALLQKAQQESDPDKEYDSAVEARKL